MTHDQPVTRREALAVGAAMTRPAPAADDPLPWVDAHAHIWPADADTYPLAPGVTKKDLDPPSFTDEELMALARPEGVARGDPGGLLRGAASLRRRAARRDGARFRS